MQVNFSKTTKLMLIDTTLHSKSCCHFLMIYVKKSITEYLHGQNFDIKFLLFALLLRLCTQVTLKMHSFSAYQTCAIFLVYYYKLRENPV